VKYQACAIKDLQVLKVSFSSLHEVSDFFQSFQSFERVFVVAFLFKMFSFQMESLKVMEKFDGGNFHLWKFKMRMMHSKHGLWKFIDGNAILPNEEVVRADYNEKKGDDMLVHINMVKALVDQLCSIEVNITNEDVYMVLLMSLLPSFDNLVTSLESMSTKDVDLQFIVARLLHGVSKKKEYESSETTTLLNKTHKSNEKFCFYYKKFQHFVKNCLKKKNDEKEKSN